MNAQLHSATATSAAVSHDGWAGYPDVTASQRGDGDGNAFTAGRQPASRGPASS